MLVPFFTVWNPWLIPLETAVSGGRKRPFGALARIPGTGHCTTLPWIPSAALQKTCITRFPHTGVGLWELSASPVGVVSLVCCEIRSLDVCQPTLPSERTNASERMWLPN